VLGGDGGEGGTWAWELGIIVASYKHKQWEVNDKSVDIWAQDY
jgi:hypothetical protein